MAAYRLVKLGSIRWPILPGQGWPITIAADADVLPDLSRVVSAVITWRSGALAEQTRDLTLDETTRTATQIQAAYAFVAPDLPYIQEPGLGAPSDIRGYVTLTLDDDSKKESAETIVIPLRREFV